MPGALLSRSHLRELGLERRAVDAVFRELDVVVLPVLLAAAGSGRGFPGVVGAVHARGPMGYGRDV